jgi:hypothetical protein
MIMTLNGHVPLIRGLVGLALTVGVLSLMSRGRHTKRQTVIMIGIWAVAISGLMLLRLLN